MMHCKDGVGSAIAGSSGAT
uniref:Uncharacterized protein n=1 Tax=Arundo donax TaxID=35708 RepID=A0A0A9GTG1_ARUDO